MVACGEKGWKKRGRKGKKLKEKELQVDMGNKEEKLVPSGMFGGSFGLVEAAWLLVCVSSCHPAAAD